ncbi:MAG: SulP family inorganic anion transporter [Nannocystaceae bacterium]
MSRRALLPLPKLARYQPRDFPADLFAALAVCILAVPQGLAYATIAGLPPVMGLYASAVPAIVGSLTRSSRHVIAGPTNALSLLVGAAVASGLGADPAAIALTLALMVGVMQVAAGALRLGTLVDYISGPVVLGYITGAGVLIGVGQLYNVTGTSGERGPLVTTVVGWSRTVSQASWLAVVVALGTVALVVLMRLLSKRIGRRIPGSVVAMVAGIIVNVALDLEGRGLRVVSDLSPIPAGFSAPALPDLSSMGALLPAAVACTVLSLVESNALARSIASRTGQRLDASTEFVGQGLANVAAGLWGGYPVSGSLSRSALNERGGAKTRVAGIISGVLMIGVLLAFGSTLDHTPIASLAGLLLVVAWDLVDGPRIRSTVRASWSDGLAFIVTVIGTWTLSLDTAIYLGVGVSVILFLRRARSLVLREMILDDQGRWQECTPGGEQVKGRLPGIRILQVEGPLFFAAVNELTTSIDDVMRDERAQVLILRLRRAQGMDATVAGALAETAVRAQQAGRCVILTGVSAVARAVMARSGADKAFAEEHLLPIAPKRFASLELACDRGRDFIARAGEGVGRTG